MHKVFCLKMNFRWENVGFYSYILYICLSLSAVIPKKSVRFSGSVGCILFFMGCTFVVFLFGGVLGNPPVFCFIFPVEFQLSLAGWWGCWSTEWMSSDQGATLNSCSCWGELAVCCKDPRWSFHFLLYFHPYLGRSSNLNNIFQMGWNDQLGLIFTHWKNGKNDSFKP